MQYRDKSGTREQIKFAAVDWAKGKCSGDSISAYYKTRKLSPNENLKQM